MPEAKKMMRPPDGRSPQRAATRALTTTSSGRRTAWPVAPDAMMRCGGSTWVWIWVRRRMAALRASAVAGRARRDDAVRRIDLVMDLGAAANGGVAVERDERGDLPRIGLEPCPRRGARDRRQQDCGEQPDDRQHADDLEQNDAALARLVRRALRKSCSASR